MEVLKLIKSMNNLAFTKIMGIFYGLMVEFPESRSVEH